MKKIDIAREISNVQKPAPAASEDLVVDFSLIEILDNAMPKGFGQSKTAYRGRLTTTNREVCILELRDGDVRNEELQAFEKVGKHPALTRLLHVSRNTENGRQILVTVGSFCKLHVASLGHL